MIHPFKQSLAYAGLFALLAVPTATYADDAEVISGSSSESSSLLKSLYPEAGDMSRQEILDRVLPNSSALPAAFNDPTTSEDRRESPHSSGVAPAPDAFLVEGDPAMRAQLTRSVLPSFEEIQKSSSGLASLTSVVPNFYEALNLVENPAYEKPEGDAEGTLTEITTRKPPVFDVNEADKAGLMETLGLDARRARYVIEYRKIFGLFESPEDLLQVAGINDGDIVLWEKQGFLDFD